MPEETQNIVSLLQRIASAKADGVDLIETPSSAGGILVSEEIACMAADMETAAYTKFDGDFGAFNAALLVEIRRAYETNVDPLEEIQCWLADMLENYDQVLPA